MDYEVGAWTRGDVIEDRPTCQLVRYLVCLNVACLFAAHGVRYLLFGGTEPISVTWIALSVVAFLGHVAFVFLFAWLDGEPIGAFGSVSDGGSGDGDGGGGDGGGGGD